MPSPPRRSRIQTRNRETILEAALEVFSQYGFRGATLDQIAEKASLSKPNLLYYFTSKEDIYRQLLDDVLQDWLEPLRALSAEGDPRQELQSYVARKLEMSREMPRQSRLFANEILQGAPHVIDLLGGSLKDLVDEKSAVLQRWMDQGRIAKMPPQHLLFSIWALTQHYADFDIQVRAVLGPSHDPFTEAGSFLTLLFERLLSPA